MHRLPEIIPGLSAIAGTYQVILSDIWGVVHDGERHFAPAVDALARFRAAGGVVVLITNAPRPHGPIREQLDELGVPHAAYDNLVTSGDATIALMGARPGQTAYHIGPERDLTLFAEAGRVHGGEIDLRNLDQADYVVCTGLFNDDVETPDDYQAILTRMLQRDLVMICANPDIIVHRGTTLLYCSGALAERYARMGGKVLQAGKPYAAIYTRALALADKPKANVLAIGDAMATDIMGAHIQAIDSLFVTHGIHRDKLHADGLHQLDGELLKLFLADVEVRPRYAINQLRW